MKAYFVASIAGKRFYKEYYQMIIRTIRELDYDVSETIMEISVGKAVQQTVSELREVYKGVLSRIRDSDVFVCDMTQGSPGVSMEVQDAIYRYKKPALILYHESKEGRMAAPFFGNPSKLLFIEKYNENNLKEVLRTFFKRAEKKIPSQRFTVRMSEELDEYIEYLRILWKETSKNKVVNKIIEDMMVEDTTYRDFLSKRKAEI